MSPSARKWLKGLVAAFVSGAANALVVLVADPHHFSPSEVGGLKKLGFVIVVSALVGVGLYLKQSPVPPNGHDAKEAS
jgi:hypothetical protein